MATPFLRAVATAAAFLPALAPAEPISFDQALDLAAQRSEAARAGRAASTSAQETVRAAGQLPDPVLRAGIENLPVTGSDRFSAGRESMTMKRIGISQEWLSTDKRAAREAAAQAMAGRESLQISVAESEARLQAALAYLDAWYADAALKWTVETEHHLHEALEAAHARLAAATGSAAEVLQISVAKGIAADESEEARQQQAVAMVALQRWVGLLPDALTAPPAFRIPTEPEYLARHPMRSMLQRDVDVARQNAASVAKERTPNWTWEVAYGQRTGYSDMVSVGVSIPLQIAPSRRQDREIAAKLALVDKAEADLAEGTREAVAQYRAMTTDATHLQQRVERYQASVATPARQRTAAELAAYRSNQAPLTALFEARRMELEAQRKLLALQRDLAKAQAQLVFKPLAQGSGR